MFTELMYQDGDRIPRGLNFPMSPKLGGSVVGFLYVFHLLKLGLNSGGEIGVMNHCIFGDRKWCFLIPGFSGERSGPKYRFGKEINVDSV